MLKVASESDVRRLANDLQEDLATRWIPDVLADVDLTAKLRISSMSQDDVLRVEVPRVDGGIRVAPMLSGSALRALRDAVGHIRELSEAAINPAVCGYRTGASGDSRYSDEYHRFREITAAMADQHCYVAIADVCNFFESVRMPAVRNSMLAKFGAAWAPVETFVNHARLLGVSGIPAGYGDARLIANLILTHADDRIGVQFTRWVDDYRIFADSKRSVNEAIARLETGLAEMGLRLNHKKLRVLESSEYRQNKYGAPLDSVYHPQDEAPEVVRANLRAVFLRAVAENNRRLLRFALPRLAQQGDDIAVSFVLRELSHHSVDAPRMAHYLSAFIEDENVAAQVEDLVSRASEMPWVLLRLSPLLVRISLKEETLKVLAEIVLRTSVPAVWGLILRILSVHKQAAIVRNALSSVGRAPDVRAAVAAYSDLDWRVPHTYTTRAPQTIKVLQQLSAVPLPKVESLL